jgi:RHS repeat-associated protein
MKSRSRRAVRRTRPYAPAAEVLELRRLLSTYTAQVAALPAVIYRPTSTNPGNTSSGRFSVTISPYTSSSFLGITIASGSPGTYSAYLSAGGTSKPISSTYNSAVSVGSTFDVIIVPNPSSTISSDVVVTATIWPASNTEVTTPAPTNTATITIKGYGTTNPNPPKAPSPETPTPQAGDPGPNPCGPQKPQVNVGGAPNKSGVPSSAAEGNVDGATGVVTSDPVAFTSGGFGKVWGQATDWTSVAEYSAGGTVGRGFVNLFQPTIQQAGAYYRVVNSATDVEWFVPDGAGGYVAQYFSQDGLALDGATGDLVLTDTLGDVTRFYGFGAAANLRGKFRSYTDSYGYQTSTTYNGSGQLTKTTRTDGSTTETYNYTYNASGDNAGLMSRATLSRSTSPGTFVRIVDYTYYASGAAAGNVGDLQLEQVKDGAGNVIDTTYYRYYTADSATGFADGLKYVFHQDSYARLAAAVANPLAASDATVAPYADNYYEYDADRRATKSVVQGDGCACGGGLGEYSYAYSPSPYAGAFAGDYNVWTSKTVETLPDGNQNIYYYNAAGEPILKAFYDVADAGDSALTGKVWATYYRYDAAGRMIMSAQPSGVALTSLSQLAAAEAKPDLVGLNAGSYAYLNASSGAFHYYDYAYTAPAGSGDVVGYLKGERIGNGYNGTTIKISEFKYDTHADANGAVVHPLKSSEVYSGAGGAGGRTTTYTYFWYPSTNGASAVTTTFPSISGGASGQNGPGTSDAETTWYNSFGLPTWFKDADGYIRYTAYDAGTGAAVATIDDFDTTKSGVPTPPSGLTTPAGGGLHLTTSFTVDALGRTTRMVDADTRVTYWVYNDPGHEVRIYRGWSATTGTTTGPIEVVRYDAGRKYDETFTMATAPAKSGSAGSYVPTGGEAVANLRSLSRILHDDAGRTVEVDEYFNLSGVTYSAASVRLGTKDANYYATFYGYDDRGRTSRIVNPVGTITFYVYDSLGRVATTSVGTDDPYDGSSGTTNMSVVARYEYDGRGVGDGDLTKATTYPNGDGGLATPVDPRVVQYAYDWRGRLVAMKLGVQASEGSGVQRPLYYYEMDNLGEVTSVSLYDGDGIAVSASKPAQSLRRAYTEYAYDDQGRVYRQKAYSVNQSTGALGPALTTSNYYNRRGDLIATYQPGGLVTKFGYDGAGRVVDVALTDGAEAQSWDAAGRLTSDHVLSETRTTYNGVGDPIVVASLDRYHDATATGALVAGTNARASYAAAYYDAADRLYETLDVGTNGGSAFARPAPGQARSDTVHVVDYAYDDAGRVGQVLDPMGRTTSTAYDALGRAVQVVSTGPGGGPSTTSTTRYAYTGLDQIKTVTAVGATDQVTTYEYGSVKGVNDSKVASNDLLLRVVQPNGLDGAYPSGSVASHSVSYKYNALGEAISATDANGTTHAYAYDVVGRRTSDAVTALGSGVDGAVRRIETAYDSAGRPYLFTSYNAASGGSIVNQVKDVFNGFGQLTAEYQGHGGAVVDASTPRVQYGYAEGAGGANNSRLTSATYPNGRVVGYAYSSTIDDKISRPSSITDGVGGAVLESYKYLGLGTIVERAQPGARVKLTYVQQAGDAAANGDGGDQYTGLDRFGRVIDQNWVRTSAAADGSAAGTSTARYQYGYDRDDEVVSRNDLVKPGLSELYQYDQLGRLTSYKRGVLSASAPGGPYDTIASPTMQQAWTLDAVGNWGAFSDVDAAAGTSTNTTRGFNAGNQAAAVAVDGVSSTAPTYDANGNTKTKDGKSFVYDAWNRLVAVKTGATTIAAYAYDALRRRIKETVGAATTDVYFSSDSRVVEERIQDTIYLHVLGASGDVVFRDTYVTGTLHPEWRWYAQEDAAGSTTALVGGYGSTNAGAVLERYAYEPYGDSKTLNPDGTVRSSSLYGWRFLFQGGRIDAATGLYAFGLRDYDVAAGVWMERDPIGLDAGDPNLYRFVGNNPVNFVDPTGMDGEPWVYFDWATFAAYYRDMAAAVATGEAGRALGDKAVQTVQARTGQDFAGSPSDYGRFAQSLAGELAGTTPLVEGISGYDVGSQQPLDATDRWSRGLGGGGGLALSGFGTLGTLSRAPARFPTAARLMPRKPPRGVPAKNPTKSACPAEPQRLYKRGSFRRGAVTQAVNEAPVNAQGQMICPTCSEVIPETITIQTKNGPKVRRGFDLDHYPDTWAERVARMKDLPEPPTRSDVLNEYNSRLRVQCPACNQSHRFEGIH